MRLQGRVKMLQFHCTAILQIQELVDLAKVFLAELIVVGKGNLPLAPGHIVRQVPIHRIVSLLYIIFCQVVFLGEHF